MTCKILIRPYKYGDESKLKRLLADSAMTTVWSVFLATARRELVSQTILILSAICFVVFGLPLIHSILAFPTVMLLLLIGIWVGHKVKVITTHKDLNDIQKEYQSNPRCGFWVAELISGDAQQMHCKTKQIDIISLGDSDTSMIELERRTRGCSIIGSIAITVKQDSTNEPHQSVAWLRRMAVDKTYRKMGIGAALADTALEHCARSNYRAVELLTTEHHQAARSLYAIKGFELIETIEKTYLGGIICFVLYRLRMPCIVTRANLSA
jgi:ribosomal protein S18 acetylase RimI-like enzyme